MDDSVFKQKYKKCKLRVKLWEKDFKKRNGRVPSKLDIREAPREIRDSYKMYYRLKTSFLEDTLNDVLDNDGFDILEMSQATDCGGDNGDDDDGCLSFNGGPQLPHDIAAIVNANNSSENSINAFSNLSDLPTTSALSNLISLNEEHVVKDFEAVQDLELNKKAWTMGNKKASAPVPAQDQDKKESSSLLRTNLNPKLFKSASSFSKRNPRKSLSRSNTETTLRDTQSSCSDGWSQQESLPDLETILTQKAKEQQQVVATAPIAPAVVTSIPDNNTLSIKTQVDEDWLNRNTQETTDQALENAHFTATTNTLVSKPNKTYGITGIDRSKLMPKSVVSSKTDTTTETVHCDDLASVVAATHTTQKDVGAHISAHKFKRKAVKSDSDSVVSGSDEEDKIVKCSSRIKRRRFLAVDEKVATKVAETSKPENVVNKNAGIYNTELEAQSIADFSNDDEKDVDFEPPKSEKKKRKTIVAKRSKPGKVKIKETKPKNDAPKTKRNATKTKQTKSINEPEDQTAVKLPPTAEELKCALALDGGSLKPVPRVTLTELKLANGMVNKYINTHTESTHIQSSDKSATISRVSEKRLEAKRILEEKIKSGRLNENFVRINIEKKRYARGKKTINYSKYKKKLWRDKKRVAALTGPDMDMGGCDGGVLKCFTCGQVGHFARNCKIKGDTLLPLTVQLEDDPSPFLTLEEAAQMATEHAIVAHSKNITKLPQAANVAMLHADSNGENSEISDVEHKQNDGDDDDKNVYEDKTKTSHVPLNLSDDEDLNDFDPDAAILNQANEQQNSSKHEFVGHVIPKEFLEKAGLDGTDLSRPNSIRGVSALYDLKEDGTVRDVTPEVMEALHMFGHTNFRKGQDRAIMRVLSGLSTLVTLSTGSGKSLCYQLPAYLYSRQKKSITLVVSPLVSLMEDQVTGVPHFLRAHCLHTNQTKQQRAKIMQMIGEGEVDILLVSPEAIVAGERSNGFSSILRQLPPIAFACIDEAHCVSQWSHNFRPSYLMICKVLKKNLGVRTVLGLTATATLPTRLSIIDHLGIPDGEKGIISDVPLPDNLILSVSKDANRDAALLSLLNSERFDQCQSILIYCTRRDECERVAGFLRTSMQDYRAPDGLNVNAKKKRKRLAWQAEPYHAGMPASRRRVIQNAFMKNELRIVVATIAFGMGINKPDIRAVIHYNMPRSFESYVQEIGRAGRDGKISHCHLFLDAGGGDQNELRRHIYANSIDRHVIRKLLQNVFVPCSCGKNNKSAYSDTASSSMLTATEQANAQPVRKCPGHEIGFSVEETVQALDIPEENISTLLCYMELDTRWNVNILSSAYLKAKVISYGGAKYLKYAAKECPPLAMAIALEIKQNRFKENSNIFEFPVVDIASAIGWNSGVVKHQLKKLEWVNVRGYAERSPLTVQFVELGFRLNAPGDFTPEEIDDALDTLYNRSVKQEETQLMQLQYIFQGLSSVAYNNYIPCSKEDYPLARSVQLKALIRDYFQNNYPQDFKLETKIDSVPDSHIIDDIHAIINMYPDNNFSGRTIARIFHGIQSPNYPAVIWGRCKFWRTHFKSDFNRIVRLANAVIVKRRT